MPDMKQQIVSYVKQVDDVRGEIARHWSMIQKSVSDGEVDAAISLLNAYFRLKLKLEVVEGQLAGLLGGYFSDK